jgi:hypothetical protein
MMLKRLKQLVIGGAALAALALGSSASAGAATRSSGSSSTMAIPQGSSSGAPRASFVATHARGPTAHKASNNTVTADAEAKASAAPLARGRGGSTGAMHHVRDSWIHDLYLTPTDHEQYVRHHERLASEP